MNNPTLYFPPINKLGNVAFRKVCNNSGADFVFTEMIRVEKIIEENEFQLRKLLIPQDMQTKTIVQIICEKPENIEKSIDKIVELTKNAKEINYNMGCPQSTMAKNENGGGIVKNPTKVKLVAEILAKCCEKHNILPSIKIRIGYDRKNINIQENIQNIKNAGINKIYIHGRCLLDGYRTPATYQEIGEIKKLFPELEIIANGDVIDTKSYNRIINETNCDGILIGRAALRDPYIFKQLKTNTYKEHNNGFQLKTKIPQIIELLKAGQEENLNLDYLKQNIIYMTKGVIGGKDFRRDLNDISDINIFIEICEKYL